MQRPNRPPKLTDAQADRSSIVAATVSVTIVVVLWIATAVAIYAQANITPNP